MNFRMEVVPRWNAGAAAQLNKATGAPPSDTASLLTHPVLVIEPLQPKWKEMTADLLTQVFVEAQQFGTYRTLLRRRISSYLDGQAKLMPKAVVLTATLHCSGSPTGLQHKHPEASQDLQEHPLPNSPQEPSEGATSTQQLVDMGRQYPQTQGSDHVSLQHSNLRSFPSCELTEQQRGSDHVSSQRGVRQRSSPSCESMTQQQQHSRMQRTGQVGGDEGQSPSDSHWETNTACAQHLPHTTNALTQPPHSASNSARSDASPVSGAANCKPSSNTHSSSCSSSNSKTSGRDHELESTSGGGVEVLVGTAEVSFDRITHGRHLYLNPPNKAAYLCNMAVDPLWRQLGIGRALLEAVEQLALAGQESEVYLHMRVKDVPAAWLYITSGYKEVGREIGWLSQLLRRDQKMLMAKSLR
ncbi:hypothetical protein DUNSADRAFT_2074 [Dunaliella salina]|uniref:N-acetyltransferase domain-containing protein n=1 Tax=Dunaliella salina TaxID=3046 RepID=A0ABQ7FWN3_DUNSA|nr:hypothetical protein DUNSADRAFT_2074 [Dunaliella salina]|eukprot:KAF5826774.1 hypothetical protein DUNSADRAFT_2074 [Dunaliella salina]